MKAYFKKEIIEFIGTDYSNKLGASPSETEVENSCGGATSSSGIRVSIISWLGDWFILSIGVFMFFSQHDTQKNNTHINNIFFIFVKLFLNILEEIYF